DVKNLALGALLAAAALAVLTFPFRVTWWGGLLLAIGEAGVVGGLADWFAVTALFRRPLGLPIPHTALIPANWELLARRVGTMAEVIEAVIERYREGMTAGPRFLLGLAHLFGVVDRDRLVSALQTGLREVARDPAHPLRAQIAAAVAELPSRLRNDAKLAARV